MRVLITGVTGFVGRHLAAHARSRGGLVYGIARGGQKVPGVKMLRADLLDKKALRRAVLKARPQVIFHLAGMAFVPLCSQQPKRAFATNVQGTQNLFEAALALMERPRVLVSGSAEEYGLSKGRSKIRESAPMRPSTVYGLSKMLQEVLGFDVFSRRGLPVVRVRAFNHIGPGQSELYSASGFAKQAAAIELGLREPEIRVGNLRAVRDFTDVRDVVRAYWLLMKKGRAGEVYNVASGKGRRIEEILRFYLRRTSVKIRVVQDPAHMRPSDVPYFVGDASKLRRATGWRPQIGFERMLNELYEDWKGRLRVRKK